MATGSNPYKGKGYKKAQIDVYVTATNGSSGPEYKQEVGSKDSDRIDLPFQGGPYLITFHLKDETNPSLGLHFHAEDIPGGGGESPIFCDVTTDDQCPRSLNKQIEVEKNWKEDRLRVTDWNYSWDDQPLTMHYQLNISDKFGVKVPFDPVILNGGGIKPPPLKSFTPTALLVIGGLVVIAVIGQLAGLWRLW